MKLAVFNPAVSRDPLSYSDRAIIESLRALGDDARLEVLKLLEGLLARARAPVVVWLTIDRLHSGPKRSFWCSVPRAFLDKQTVASVDDVVDLGHEFMEARLQDQELPPRGESVLEYTTNQHAESGIGSTYLRRGRFRACLHLPRQYEQEWLQRAVQIEGH